MTSHLLSQISDLAQKIQLEKSAFRSAVLAERIVGLSRLLSATTATAKPDDTVRVLRILEYTGPRNKVEELVAKSVHGERRLTNVHDPSRGVVIRAATIGSYPEILASGDSEVDTDTDPLDDSGSLGQAI